MASIQKTLLILIISSLPLATGVCLFGSDDSAEEGSTTSLSTADIEGDWDTACIETGTMEGPTGYAGYIDWLSVTGTAFTLNRSWYTTVTNGYCTGSIDVNPSVYGTVAVGELVSGSTTTSTVQFTITSATVRGYTAGARTILNNACGLSLTNSNPVSVLGNSCGAGYTANPSDGAVIDNVITLSTSTELMLGALETTMFIPGVLHGNTVATAATVVFTKR